VFDPSLDSLTGAYARSALVPCIQQALEESTNNEHPFSMVMLDLDYLKSINDAFGHLRGDQVLSEIVRRVQAVVRKGDEIFRYGGDEFIVLLPHSGGASARSVAERIQISLSKDPVQGDPPISVSVSMGLVSFPVDGKSIDELFEVMDQRLYQGKSLGRGRIIHQESGKVERVGALLRPPDRMLERDYALQQMRVLLTQLAEIKRGILPVRGVAGSGRTRFLEESVKLSRQQGYAIWQVSGSSALRVRYCGALAQMQQASGWKKIFYDRAPLAEALNDWLEEKKARGLVVCLDNVDGVDRATLETLTGIMESGPRFPVGLIYSGDVAHFGGEVPVQAPVELNRLSERSLLIWLRLSLHWEPPQRFVSWLYQQTEGLPKRIAHGLLWLDSQGLLRSETDGWSVAELDGMAGFASQVAEWGRPLSNLPVKFSNFWNRAEEIWQLKNALQGSPLVTICGPDGMGKTRLAMQTAAECQDQFPDGVCWVSLETEQDEEGLLGQVADFFHVSGHPFKGLVTRLGEFLRGKQVLLVLDGVGTSPDGMKTSPDGVGTPPDGMKTSPDGIRTSPDGAGDYSAVFQLLKRLTGMFSMAPGLRVFVTATMALQLPEETVLELGGLSLPKGKNQEVLSEHSALQLFVQNAREGWADFTPQGSDWPWILRICQLVEGMPMGIEMAAAWVSIYSCETIAREIEKSLNFLTKSGLDGQRSLGAVFDSSWQRFSPQEQAQLEILTIFKEGFSHEAAASVAGASPFFIDALVNKKILRAMHSQRFGMHHLLAQYAAAQLHDDPERNARAQRLHAEYFLRLAGSLEGTQAGPTGQNVLRLAVDLQNICAAWRLAVQEDWCDLLELGQEGLFVLLTHLGRFKDGITLFTSALDILTPGCQPLFSIRLRQALGELYFHTGQYAAGIPVLEAALRELVTLDEPAEQANTLRILANLHTNLGDYSRALALLEQSLVIIRPLNQPGLKFSMNNRAGVVAYFQKDTSRAAQYFQLALEYARQTDDLTNVAVCLVNLGDVATEKRDFERARPLLLESLQICSTRSMSTLQGSVLNSLGGLGLASGDRREAAEYFSQALRFILDNDADPLVVEILSRVAELWQDEDATLSERLARVVVQHPACPHDIRQRAAELIARLEERSALPETAHERTSAAWSAGHLRRVVVDVLELLKQT
jgi:diguanylate cyclase (GGDEF)-like protein